MTTKTGTDLLLIDDKYGYTKTIDAGDDLLNERVAIMEIADGVMQDVNVEQLGGEDIDLGSGTTDVGTQRVTIATDDLVSEVAGVFQNAIYQDGLGTPDWGLLMMGTDGTNPQAIAVNADGELKVNLETADIEIGAVELKNATTDDRALVTAANTGRAATDMTLLTQAVDAAGAVLSTSALALEAGNLATIAGDTTSIDGKITACNTGAVVVASGAITETNSATIAGDTTSIDGKITACNTGAVVVASGSITETNSATIAGDTTSIDGKITACNTGAVVVASGSITETNSATIAGDTTSIDGKITACNTGAVVVASGAITETNSGAIKTAVELLDDCVDVNLLRVEEQNAARFGAITESLVDDTSVAAATYYYPSSTGGTMLGYTGLSVDGRLDAGAGGTCTFTFEATNDEDTASGVWHDITKAGYRDDTGTTTLANIASSGAVEDFSFRYPDLNYASYRIKIVIATTAADALSLKLRRRP